MTRWNIVISDETDKMLRAFLGQAGAKKGDLSKFVEDAVRKELFNNMVETVRTNINDDLAPDEIDDLINEAIAWVRADNS